jgi:hypothetical protein
MVRLLKQIACAHCGGAGLELTPEGKVVCKFCGTPNSVPGVICPQCWCVNITGTDICGNCQVALFRACPNCQTKNWRGAAECVRCGQSFDSMEGMVDRLRLDTSGRLNRQQQDAAAIKAAEEEAANRRLEQLRDVDRRREQAQAEAMARRAANESRLLMGLLIVGGLVVVLIIAAIILTQLPH